MLVRNLRTVRLVYLVSESSAANSPRVVGSDRCCCCCCFGAVGWTAGMAFFPLLSPGSVCCNHRKMCRVDDNW